jgi:predicted PurR-regulated permease PerM
MSSGKNGVDSKNNTTAVGLLGSERTFKIIISVIVLAVAFITFWFMMDLAILTFILTFVFYHFQKMLDQGLRKAKIGAYLPHWVSLILVYAAGITAIVLLVWGFTTVIIGQSQEIARTLMGFDINTVQNSLDPQIAKVIEDLNIYQYINTAIERIGSALLDLLGGFGSGLLNFGISIIISFLFLIERANISRFGSKAAESRIGFIYDYFIRFGGNFCRTFGKVMKVQVTIALVNSLISTVFLHFFGMPNVLGLGVIIFSLGLIPVAGVVISIIPLSIIAVNTGGLIMVLKILIMIVVLHAIEAYVLNPKLMASRTALPVSFVFVILIVAERYLNFWGLLIGVPLFIFIMTVFQVDYEEVCKQPPSKIAQKIRSMVKARRDKAQG